MCHQYSELWNYLYELGKSCGVQYKFELGIDKISMSGSSTKQVIVIANTRERFTCDMVRKIF
jgi:hypothetical protein